MSVADPIGRSVNRLVLNDRDGLSANIACPGEAHRSGFSFRTQPRNSGGIGCPLRDRPFLDRVPDVAQVGERRSPAKSVPPVCLFFRPPSVSCGIYSLFAHEKGRYLVRIAARRSRSRPI